MENSEMNHVEVYVQLNYQQIRIMRRIGEGGRTEEMWKYRKNVDLW